MKMSKFIQKMAKDRGITDIQEYLVFEESMHEFAETIAYGAMEFIVGNHSKVTDEMIQEDTKFYIQAIK